jgi:hypothetical protein
MCIMGYYDHGTIVWIYGGNRDCDYRAIGIIIPGYWDYVYHGVFMNRADLGIDVAMGIMILGLLGLHLPVLWGLLLLPDYCLGLM